jgi:tetratricopeptide (TPR) repeat protein
MIDPQENKRGRLVPKWLEYPKAIGTGELVVPRQTPFEINEATKKSIKHDLEEFATDPTSQMACRLMGAGIILGDNELSHDMASFIIDKRGVDPLSIKLANKILNITHNDEPLLEVDVRISKLRKWVSMYPRSAIGWIELSRAFTIKGQKEKAKRAAMTALQIAPYERYIVRCAVRLFLHIGDLDRAWYYVERASKYRFDPWIKATEVNVALISERKVPHIKKFIPRDILIDQLFDFSELLDSYGCIELDSGNDRTARKQFRLAWKKPSGNVITHAEWVIRNKLPGMKESCVLEFDRSPEAKTWINYFDLNVGKAMDAVREWELEEPYSKHPFIVGSFIACHAGHPKEGVKIAKRGVMVNPHSKIIYNNLCYALLRAGNVTEADKYINKLKAKNETDSDMISKATLGLYAFRKKNVTLGRQTYIEVIDYFKQTNNPELQALALLNLTLAELEAQTPESNNFAVKCMEATKKMKSPHIILMRKLVQEKFREFGGHYTGF